MLLLRSGAGDRAVAAEAAAALGQLKSSWPAADFRSYLNRPIIGRMHAGIAARLAGRTHNRLTGKESNGT
jgi:hypothetical protein